MNVAGITLVYVVYNIKTHFLWLALHLSSGKEASWSFPVDSVAVVPFPMLVSVLQLWISLESPQEVCHPDFSGSCLFDIWPISFKQLLLFTIIIRDSYSRYLPLGHWLMVAVSLAQIIWYLITYQSDARSYIILASATILLMWKTHNQRYTLAI